MIAIAAALLAGAVQQGASDAPDDMVQRMVALYDEACLQAFPNDEKIGALMAGKGATPLTPDEVKVTLRDDPGCGWRLKDGERSVLIFLEIPPFHACSVRWSAPQKLSDDDAGYRAVVERYKASHDGFTPGPMMDRDLGEIHVHGVTEGRTLPGGGGELLMLIDQHVIDRSRRAEGETGVSMRMVHQIRLPD